MFICNYGKFLAFLAFGLEKKIRNYGHRSRNYQNEQQQNQLNGICYRHKRSWIRKE